MLNAERWKELKQRRSTFWNASVPSVEKEEEEDGDLDGDFDGTIPSSTGPERGRERSPGGWAVV